MSSTTLVALDAASDNDICNRGNRIAVNDLDKVSKEKQVDDHFEARRGVQVSQSESKLETEIVELEKSSEKADEIFKDVDQAESRTRCSDDE
jgi:hypothetical protein